MSQPLTVVPESEDEATVLPRINPSRRVTQYVITDEELPADRLIFDGVDTTEGPLYTISEIAKVFFARSPHWIRWREKTGIFTFDGQPVGVGRTPKGARVYTLGDIEKMAHALVAAEGLNAEELANVLRICQANARMWELIA